MMEKWWMREEKQEIGKDERKKDEKWIYKSITIQRKSPSLAPNTEAFETFEISNLKSKYKIPRHNIQKIIFSVHWVLNPFGVKKGRIGKAGRRAREGEKE